MAGWNRCQNSFPDNLVHSTFPAADLLCAVPNIAIVQDWRQEKVEKYNNCKGIASDVEWCGQWCASIVDLCPIETDGEQTEAGVHL